MKMQKINNCRQNRLEFKNFALFFARVAQMGVARISYNME